ncbi:hypothetical protein F5148DRAFT_1226572 [Russula earlei]|uniref:Uncharacterized protein n=1 Tax=Russula earlei TaxID=71964 RepID=A0ACC0U0Q7_9AGAM|nr:hypothetical protein F5148DRAFT_1226572 [Russula earlei]
MADQCINSNPDIAGIGTRINFYTTILLTALTPETATELLDGLYKNSVLYGLGLVMTAVIQTFQEQLDLYHAIFVMQIIFCLNLVYEYGQRRFIRSSSRDLGMKIFIAVQTFSTVLFTVWLLYVWIKDGNFGSQPECNHLVKYVLFFANVRATVTWLRVLFIIYLILTACMLLFRFGVILSVYYMEELRTNMKELRTNIQDKMRKAVTGPEWQEQHRDTEQLASQPEQPEQTDAHRPVPAFVTLSVVSAVYGVATLELIVHRNRPNIQPGEDAWGFGQIISLILIFGSIVDIVVTVRERYTKEENPSEEVAMSRL